MAVTESMSRRIENISDFLYAAHGVRIVPSSLDGEIDRLPDLISKLGGLRTMPDEEIETRLLLTRPVARDAMRALLGRDEIDENTRLMVFDGALLWGEAFRLRYPAAAWQLAGKPRSSVYFGDPVLVGIDELRMEFDTQIDLHGFVGRILLNLEEGWAPSRIMKMRAFKLGLGPDLRPWSEGQMPRR